MKLCAMILRRILAGLIFALAIPLAVCAQEGVVVSFGGFAGYLGPLWAAKDLDLFRKYGLKAELVLITGSARAMAALISGSTDFAEGSATASIPIRLRDGDIVIIAAALNRFPFSVVAQKEIRKPSDLTGKKIGILNFGGSTELAITLALKEGNLPLKANNGGSMNYYKDLGEYVRALEREGLLIRVKRPINKDTEMHPLVRWQFRGLNEDQRKAFYFENVYDSRNRKYDMPVLIGGLAASQKIYSVGLMCKENEVNETWAHALENPIAPVLIKDGPGRIVHTGKDLVTSGGLVRLPIPISTPGFDNAPYLTAGCWITKDPETGIRNMGVYRGQIKGPLKTGVSWGSLNNCATHWEKCNRLGIPLEAAVVIGGPPCIAYAGVQTVPYGIDELSVAGGLARSPIELVRCETVDLEVPAYADVVIEGRIPTDYLEPDGPFGESHGYMDTGDLTGVFEVTAITQKPDAVFVSMISQVTPSESSKVKQSAYEASAFRQLKQDLKIPVLRVALCEDLLNRQLVVIQMKKTSAEDRWRAMESLLSSRGLQKIIICVDPDIDPYDLLSVHWAIANRSQPHRDIRIIPDRPMPWNPIRYVADGERYDFGDSALLIDATSKADLPPVALPKREFMEKAQKIWEELRLPKLSPRPPWSGYSLGHWSEEASVQADNATTGQFELNAKYSASKGIKVPKGASFVEMKKTFLSKELEETKRDHKR